MNGKRQVKEKLGHVVKTTFAVCRKRGVSWCWKTTAGPAPLLSCGVGQSFVSRHLVIKKTLSR